MMIITRTQRDALYQYVVTDLAKVGDVAPALQAGDAAEAKRLRLCYEEDLALLDLLGCQTGDERAGYELRLSDDAARALERLHAIARELIADSMIEVTGDVLGEAVQVVKACSTILRETRA